jgi:hypothetical protein
LENFKGAFIVLRLFYRSFLVTIVRQPADGAFALLNSVKRRRSGFLISHFIYLAKGKKNIPK